MEIYNEKVRDLLRPPSMRSPSQASSVNLKVREHPKEGPYVESKASSIQYMCLLFDNFSTDLSKQQISDYQAIEELISIGNAQRYQIW